MLRNNYPGQETPPAQPDPDRNRLRELYDQLAPVSEGMPEYETFRDKLSTDRAARKRLYNRIQGAEGVPEDFSTFERKLFSVEETREKKDQFTEAPEMLKSPGQPETKPAPDESFRDTAEKLNIEAQRLENQARQEAIPLPGGRTRPNPDLMEQARALRTQRNELISEESKRSRNPLVNYAQTIWNVSSKQIPALIKGGYANIYQDPAGLMLRADKAIRGLPGIADLTSEEQDDKLETAEESREEKEREVRAKLLRQSLEGQQEFAESQEGAVMTTADIHDSIDFVNYITNNVAQATAQIPAALLTLGGTSLGQEIGIIYTDQVKQIAEKEGITPEEVIKQGKDDRISSAIYGGVAGGVDLLGAKKAAGKLTPEGFKKDLRRRGMEFLKAFTGEAATEGAQSAIEQFGASHGAGDGWLEALTGVNLREVVEESLAGGIGGGGVNVASQATKAVLERGTPVQETFSDKFPGYTAPPTAPEGAAPETTSSKPSPILGDTRELISEIEQAEAPLDEVANREEELRAQARQEDIEVAEDATPDQVFNALKEKQMRLENRPEIKGLPEEDQKLLEEITSAETPEVQANLRAGRLMLAGKRAGIEGVGQKEPMDIVTELQELAAAEPEALSEETQSLLDDIVSSEEPEVQANINAGKLMQLGREAGIEDVGNKTPVDIVSELQQIQQERQQPPPSKKPPAQETPSELPPAPNRLKIGQEIKGEIDGDYSNEGLSMAARDSEGNVIVRPRNEVATHAQLLDEAGLDPEQVEMGFVSPAGRFLNRNQASTFQKIIDPEFQPTAPGVVFAEEINEEATKRKQPPEIKPGTFVQRMKGGVPQFSSPKRVRETQQDEKTGELMVRLEGEKQWTPASQLKSQDPDPQATEEQQAVQSDYDESLFEFGEDIASDDLDVSAPAAERAAKIAIDNGVSSREEFWSMTNQAIRGKPNGDAIAEGWSLALSDPAYERKLSINKGEGTLSQRFKQATTNVMDGFLETWYNENHPVTVMERKLANLYAEPNRFKRENIDKSINTFMKLMPTRLSNMWDKYLNPRKRYSKMGIILREATAKNIQLTDFKQVEELKSQLADARREGRPKKAADIEAQIDELLQSDELQQFLIAKHAIESNAYAQEAFSAEINELTEEIESLEKRVVKMRGRKRKAAQERLEDLNRQRESKRHPLGMTTEQANAVLEGFSGQEGVSGVTKLDDLEEIGPHVWEIGQVYLEEAVDHGIISPQDRQNMEEVYQFHIPAHRIITDEYGNVTGGIVPASHSGDPKVFRRTGSTRDIGHILTNLTHNFDKMMRYGLKNELRIKTADVIREELARGNNGFGTIKTEGELDIGDLAIPFREVETTETVNSEGETVTESQVREQYLVFADPEMFELYQDMNTSPVGGGAFLSAVKAIMNLQHFTIIGGSLSFGPSNQFRDVTDAMQNALSELGYTDAMRIPKELLTGNSSDVNSWKDFIRTRWVPYHRAVVRYERTGETKSQAAKDYARLKELGGTTAFYRIRSQQAIMDDIGKAIKEMQDIASGKPTKQAVTGVTRKLFNGIDHWNNMWENSTRTVLFRIGLDAGMSETQAAEFALETMPNFNRVGRLGRKVNNNFLFFNASVAAMASHGFAWKKSTGKVLTASASIAMGGYLVAAMNDAMTDDDEYEKDKRVNTWKYHKNLVMNDYDENGDINQYKMPLGYSTSVYWGLGGDLYDLGQGLISQDEFNRRLATNMVDVYNPMSGADMFEDTDHTLYAMTPTWMKPAGSMATNVVFGGRLYSEYKMAQPGTEDWQLYSPYTPKAFRYATEWLNKKDIADVSPATLNLWWEWATNSAGKDIGGFIEYTKGLVTGEEVSADQLPVLRRFYADMSQAEINYRSVWERITRYDRPAPSLRSDEFRGLLDNIENEYSRVKDSETMPEYQIESMDNGIQTYVDHLFYQENKREASDYFTEQGWMGGELEDPYKEDRYRYYKRKNYTAKEFQIPRYKWKDGKFIKDLSTGKPYTMDVIRDIEGKFKTPGQDITFSEE